MKKLISRILILLAIFNLSCSDELEILEPEFTDGTILSTASVPDGQLKQNIEGVYSVQGKENTFGSKAVVFFTENKLGFYFEKYGIYFINDFGLLDTFFVTEGKWRNPVNVTNGLVRTYSDHDISRNSINKFTVYYGRESSPLSDQFELIFERPFSDKVKTDDFYIIAHRGGGRNSDYLGVSENSLEIIEKAEYYGANGIEIDIKISQDNIPFLYHDSEVNQRLLQPTLSVGPIEDYSFPQLKSFFTLRNGEQIPSLEEALDFIIEKTNLKLVWLDMKSDKPSIELVQKIQNEKIRKAESLSRNLKILIGVPSQKVYDELLNFPGYDSIPTLCELDVSKVRELNSAVWAPRWSEGLQVSSVEQMQSEGRLAFTWTLDQQANIRDFISDSKFNGILTNYPTILVYYYYAQ